MKTIFNPKAALAALSAAIVAMTLSSCVGLATASTPKKTTPAAKQTTAATAAKASSATTSAAVTSASSTGSQTTTVGKAKADGSTSKGRKTVAK